MVSAPEEGSSRAANSSSLAAATQGLLVSPGVLGGLLLTLATLALSLYAAALVLARRRARATSHRGERAAWRHHVALLLHVAVLDCASSLLAAPLELSSLAARGVWWPLPPQVELCRIALGLDAFLGACSNFGLAALALHVTSLVPVMQLHRHTCSTFPPRPLRCLRVPASLPLIWTVAALLSAPLLVFGQLVADPGGGVLCAVMLPPRVGWGGWDRLLLALGRALFSLGIPLVLLTTSGVRAAIRLCAGPGHTRLNVVALVWSLSFALLSLHRALFATIFTFSQAFSEHPTHQVPPFVSITSPVATLIFSALHYSMCALRPAMYLLILRLGA